MGVLRHVFLAVWLYYLAFWLLSPAIHKTGIIIQLENCSEVREPQHRFLMGLCLISWPVLPQAFFWENKALKTLLPSSGNEEKLTVLHISPKTLRTLQNLPPWVSTVHLSLSSEDITGGGEVFSGTSWIQMNLSIVLTFCHQPCLDLIKGFIASRLAHTECFIVHKHFY